MAHPQCDCAPCVARRERSQRWFKKNRQKVLKKNREWKKANRPQQSKVSDDELDRRALAGWRQEWSKRV
jgi:hypothetical protein